MKKGLVWLLIAVLCMSLCACDRTQKEVDETPAKWEQHEDGYYIVSEEEFASYLTEFTITTDNWNNFITVDEVTEYNAGGGVVRTYTGIGFFLPCWASEDFAVEISDGVNSRIFSSTDYGYIAAEGWDLSALTCLQAQGKITVADVPEDLWSAPSPESPKPRFAFHFRYNDKYDSVRIVHPNFNGGIVYEEVIVPLVNKE